MTSSSKTRRMSDDAPIIQRPQTPFPQLMNLAANANPLTPVIVELLKRTSQDGFDPAVCRIRDSWLWSGNLTGIDRAERDPDFGVQDSVCVTLFLNIGGQYRGGSNAALWFRIRHHPLYLADADSESIPDHAWVTFCLDKGENMAQVLLAARVLIENVPAVAVTAEQKLIDQGLRALDRFDPSTYAAKVTHDEVQLMCAGLAAAVMMYKQPEAP